jgi:hypothetical protein
LELEHFRQRTLPGKNVSPQERHFVPIRQGFSEDKPGKLNNPYPIGTGPSVVLFLLNYHTYFLCRGDVQEGHRERINPGFWLHGKTK